MPTVNGALWTLPVEFLCYLFCYIFYKIFKNKDNIVNPMAKDDNEGVDSLNEYSVVSMGVWFLMTKM